MAHEDLTTELQQPMGPDGYIVIATKTPTCGHDEDAWTRSHLAMYHDWDGDLIDAAFGDGAFEDQHVNEHYAYEEGRGELPIPHTHFCGLEYAIAQSELPRDLKNSFLTILRRLGDEASVPPEER